MGCMTSNNYIEFWNETLRQIKNDLTSENRSQEYEMWFSSAQYLGDDSSTIQIALPSSFMKDQFVNRKYDQVLVNKMQELTGKIFNFSFEVKNIQPVVEEINEKKEETSQNTNSFKPQSSQPIYSSQPITQNNPMQEESRHPDLNPSYIFDSFVPGDNISFAYNAALAVSRNINSVNKAYNPLLLYGGVGLGKTHLMQSIGNSLHKNGLKKIIYVTSENFVTEFITSIKENTTSKFSNKYRKANVLLIDDIQFFQKKKDTQEALFHIFNALYETDKQIVFTCDRPLSELRDITDRLKSRFGRGLNVDLLPPQYETRLAILEKKLEYLKDEFPENVIKSITPEVLNIVAQNIETNVRDLESCLSTIIGYAELTGTKITPDITYNLLKDKFSEPHKENITIETIQKVVAEEYNISIQELTGKGRKKNIITARQIAMYLCQQLTEFSTTEIGNRFGKNHTTVMYSCEEVKNDIASDSKTDYKIQGLIKNIKDFKNN